MGDFGRFSHLFYLTAFNIFMLIVLWARNGRFLWQQRRTLVAVTAIATLWMFVTDPIGGIWGAWFFDPTKVLGLWLFGVMPIEDLIGMALTAVTISSAVLVFGYSPRRFL